MIGDGHDIGVGVVSRTKELIAVKLDVIGVEKVGNDIDDLWVRHVRPHHFIVYGQIVEFPYREDFVANFLLAFAEDAFELDTRIRNMRDLARRDEVAVFGEGVDLIGCEHIFDGQMTVQSEAIDLILGQGTGHEQLRNVVPIPGLRVVVEDPLCP